MIVFTGIVIYSNTLRGPFLYDDVRTIVENEKIRGVSNYIGIDRVFQKRPFADLTFALNYRFGQLNTHGYHLVNLLIHLLNGVVVYFLSVAVLRRIFRLFPGDAALSGTRAAKKRRLIRDVVVQAPDPNRQISLTALLAALIFIAHPIQTQAVSYISQRYASLAALFYLLSVFCYLEGRILQRFTDEEKNVLSARSQTGGGGAGSAGVAKAAVFYVLAFLLGVLAFLSKQTAASLPLAILLVEYFCVDATWAGWKKKAIWIGMALLLGLGIVVFWLRGVQGSGSLGDFLADVAAASRDTEHISRWQYLFTQFTVIAVYIRLLFLPFGQNADPRFPFKEGFFDGLTPVWFLFLCALVFAAIRFRKKVPVISFGILWFFITLSVESGIIPIRDAMFEHRLYLPCFGFALAAAHTLFKLSGKRWVLGGALSMGLIVAFGFATYQRNKVWQSSDVLWADVLAKSPWNSRAHTNRGIALAREGKTSEAIAQFNESLRLKPDDPQTLMNLGNTLALLQRYPDAVRIFTQLIAFDPENAKAYFNLGTALAHQGSIAEAEKYFRKALQVSAGFVEAEINLGIALMRQGKTDEAIDCLTRVTAANPEEKDAHAYLGLAFAKQGKFKEAEKELLTAVRIDPEDARSRTNLGSVYARQGRTGEAIEQFQEVLRIKPDSKMAIRNLAILIRKTAETRGRPTIPESSK